MTLNKTPAYWARPDTGVNPNPPPHRFQLQDVPAGALVTIGDGLWARTTGRHWACLVTKGVPSRLLDVVLPSGFGCCYRLFDVAAVATEDLT